MHAPGHLRQMFHGLIETGHADTDELYDPAVAGGDPAGWLCDELFSCTDLLPAAVRAELDHAADTYGQAARLISSRWSAGSVGVLR